jgi:hypothetical protein
MTKKIVASRNLLQAINTVGNTTTPGPQYDLKKMTPHQTQGCLKNDGKTRKLFCYPNKHNDRVRVFPKLPGLFWA